jgi:hypothetical protein
MSDPDAARESIPPPQPPRPTTQRVGSTPMSQLEADEQYARQLAEQYDGSYSSVPRGGNVNQRGRQQTGYRGDEAEERNFIDDDLPVIKENLRKGFLETQSKVNGWITNLRKRIDGDEEPIGNPPQGYSQSNSQYNSGRSGDARQNTDYNRYDADPQVLSDDFAGIQMNNDGGKSNIPLTPILPNN